jgi:hypothetical protein
MWCCALLAASTSVGAQHAPPVHTAPAHTALAPPRTSAYRRPPGISSLLPLPLGPWLPASNQVNTHSAQVHVIPTGFDGQVKVCFASLNRQTPSQVTYWRAGEQEQQQQQQQQRHTALGTAHSHSQLLYVNDDDFFEPSLGPETTTKAALEAMQNTTGWAFDPLTNAHTAPWYNPAPKGSYTVIRGVEEKGDGIDYKSLKYKNPRNFYNSPVLHTVPLSGLRPGARYAYTVAGAKPGSPPFEFTAPDPAWRGATLWGLTGDVGQTEVSQRSIEALRGYAPDAVLLAGDLSYADGWLWRWDTYGDLIEPLAAGTPVLTTVGNHEVVAGESFVSYNARYPMPAEASGSIDNTYWATRLRGVQVITLNAYASTAAGSVQRAWLEATLAAVDRAATPWVVVMVHVPLYTSNEKHEGEQHFLKADVERLLYDAGVDVVLSGHVHAYERSFPVYEGKVQSDCESGDGGGGGGGAGGSPLLPAGCDPERPPRCGPVYVSLGDGGNREGTSEWQAGPQPVWSAFREAAFGVASMQLQNATHGFFRWARHACQSYDPAQKANFANASHGMNFSALCEANRGDARAGGAANNASATVHSDEFWLVRDAGAPFEYNGGAVTCANKARSGAHPATPTPPPSPPPSPPPATPTPTTAGGIRTPTAVGAALACGLAGLAAGAHFGPRMRRRPGHGDVELRATLMGDVGGPARGDDACQEDQNIHQGSVLGSAALARSQL